MDNRIIAHYEITYHQNGYKQNKYLISKEDWEDFVKPISKCIGLLPKDSKDKLLLKKFINGLFVDYNSVFPIDSPFYKSIKTGVLSLPETQGGNHNVSWKHISGNKLK